MANEQTPASPDSAARQERQALVLRVAYGTAREYISGWTENVSGGGFFLRSDGEHTIGDELKLSLSFPGLLDELVVDCRVAWVREAGENSEGGVGISLNSDLGRRKMAKLALVTNDHVYQGVTREGIYRILVVETSAFIQESCQRVLNYLAEFASESIEVSFVSHTDDTDKELRHTPPDLILCDTSVSDGSGSKMIRFLRQHEIGAKLPIIAMTSGGSREQKTLAELNIEAFLQKPIQFGELLETIIYLIHLRDFAAAQT